MWRVEAGTDDDIDIMHDGDLVGWFYSSDDTRVMEYWNLSDYPCDDEKVGQLAQLIGEEGCVRLNNIPRAEALMLAHSAVAKLNGGAT